jgi:hypothetical protein
MSKWIGVDLDGTLAKYDEWVDPLHVGEPIAPMVQRVKDWISSGIEVRIFTARVGTQKDNRVIPDVIKAIEDWCELHIGQKLPVTNMKDFGLIELWDDRAVRVKKNTGKIDSYGIEEHSIDTILSAAQGILRRRGKMLEYATIDEIRISTKE